MPRRKAVAGDGTKVLRLAWSPLGQLAASTDDGHVFTWDLRDEPRSIRVCNGFIDAIAWDAKGERLFGGTAAGALFSVDQSCGAVTFRERASGARITALDFSAQTFAGADRNGRILLWPADMSSEEQLCRRPGVSDIRWSPDGTLLAICTATLVEIYNLHGELVASFPGFQGSRVAWKPSSSVLATQDRDGTFHCFDLDSGELWNVETKIANCWEFCWVATDRQDLLVLTSNRIFRVELDESNRKIIELAMHDVPFWEGGPLASYRSLFAVRASQSNWVEVHELHDLSWTKLANPDFRVEKTKSTLPGLNRPIITQPSPPGIIGRRGKETNTILRRMDESGPSSLAFLAMATEWNSKHGGLSTFNRSVCVALAEAGLQVVCAVPAADDSEVEEALASGVVLVAAPAQTGADEASRLYRRLPLPKGFVPSIIVGHGRVTGPAAEAQVIDFHPNAFRVHFVHTAAGQIEFVKGRPDAAERAEERELIELRLATGAKLVVGVGPRLTREVGNLLASVKDPPRVCRMDPGIRLQFVRKPPPSLHCIVLGRAEDFQLKGLDIAALAMGKVISSKSVFSSPPELVVRGAPSGTSDELIRHLKKVARADLGIRVRPYSADVETIESDLRRATVLLMPSRSEGFGLVALEALSVGTPVLVSNKSGVGELLAAELDPSEARDFVVATADDRDVAAAEWERAIQLVLRNPDAAFKRAAKVANKLARKFSWRSAVERFIEEIGKSRMLQAERRRG